MDLNRPGRGPLEVKTVMKWRRFSKGKKIEKAEKHKAWSPKIWLGGDFFGWMRLLVRNRFSVGLRCLHSLVFISLATLCHTSLRQVQELIWGRQVNNTKIEHEPLFIIGHWRSGTTLLHELLTLDERHTYPTTYECIDPNHFLLTEKLATRFLNFILPSKRPMDNMVLSWDRPQEDEFALCNMGQPSPYFTIAFPNQPPQYPEYFDLEKVPLDALNKWKQCFMRFLKQVTFRNPRRIVLKSPTHSYRIKVLLDLFPNSQFIHIVRNPYVVFLSTMKMWKSLYLSQGLQNPKFDGLEEYIFDNFVHLHKKLNEARPLLDPSRFYELRYEDLVRDPVGQLSAIYNNLGLGDFEEVLPKLREYLHTTRNYKPNRYELEPGLRELIEQRWGEVIHRYGYNGEGAAMSGTQQS